MKKKTQQTTYSNVTCPFCSLLCDDLEVVARDTRLELKKNICHRAKHYIEQDSPLVEPKINGQSASIEAAISAAGQVLGRSDSPLFSGLGTDVNGMRAVMALADRCGATVDHMHGDALIRNTLALQDQGGIMTTLSEIKNRADLIILVGTDAGNYPRFFERVVWNPHALFMKRGEQRRIVYIGEDLDTRAGTVPGRSPSVIPCEQAHIGELIVLIHAIIAGKRLDIKHFFGLELGVLEDLAAQIRAACYGVIVWEPGGLQIPHAQLTIQHFYELIGYLTSFTRFAGLSLGGDDGGITASNVCAWQSAYPLRVSFSKGYPEYDAYHYSTSKLLKAKEVDALLWISSFSPERQPPLADIPTIVLAKSDINLAFTPDIFIPVATPGLDHAGHLFRTDSSVSLPLRQLRHGQYHAVSDILGRILEQV